MGIKLDTIYSVVTIADCRLTRKNPIMGQHQDADHHPSNVMNSSIEAKSDESNDDAVLSSRSHEHDEQGLSYFICGY